MDNSLLPTIGEQVIDLYKRTVKTDGVQSGNFDEETMRWAIEEVGRNLIASYARAEKLSQTHETLESAAKWNALVGSSRIRVLGSSGLTTEKSYYGEDRQGYAHLGLELWTIGPGHETDNLGGFSGNDWLEKYVNIMRENQGTLNTGMEVRTPLNYVLRSDDVQWIINSANEVGVRVGNQCFFYHESRSVQYSAAAGLKFRPICSRDMGNLSELMIRRVREDTSGPEWQLVKSYEGTMRRLVPDDVASHRVSWRNMLVEAKKANLANMELDHDERTGNDSYYDHEIRRFDSVFDELATISHHLASYPHPDHKLTPAITVSAQEA